MPNSLPLCLVLSDIRSTANVGSMLRTADAAKVDLVIPAGYTPYPRMPGDNRPPHIIASNTQAIAKTALGAESTVSLQPAATTLAAINHLRHLGYTVSALEQAEGSTNLFDYLPTTPLALIVGNEVTGLPPDILAACDVTLELPMLGQKESLNVAVATGIALYQLRFGRH